MRYGLEVPSGGACADPRFLAALARDAEDAGFEAVFLEDYITYWSEPGCPTADPWVALAAMAMATDRVRLGTTVTAASRRRPWKLSREVVTLDHLSGGRVTLAVGLGDVTEDGFARVNEERGVAERGARLDETLDILCGLWRGEPFSYAGAHYTVDDVRFRPVPVQDGGVPVWVGGGWPRPAVLRRALRHNGICPYRYDPANPYRDADEEIDPDDVREIRAAVTAERGSADGFDIALGGRRRRPDWSDRLPALAEAGATWWLEWIPPGPPAEMRAAVARGPYGAG